MSKLTQKTQVFFVSPTGDAIVRVESVVSLNPGGNPAEQIEDTDLEAGTRTYKPGLRTPGQASMEINADPEKASHIQMHEMSQDDPPPTVKWIVGWSDGTEPPTVAAGVVTLPTTRTWFEFDGYISDFPFDFSSNAVVKTAVSIQRSGAGKWTKKGVV